MRLIFLGTPEFALPSLRALSGKHRVELVVTRPSRPAGRSAQPKPPPVYEEALRLGLPCIQPESLNTAEAVAAMESVGPDALVAVAYGRIIGKRVLELAPHGVLNLHPSLLPRHRGASPIQTAILEGDVSTGVTVIRMDEGLDTGPILAQEAAAIGPDETSIELTSRLAERGASLLTGTLERLESGLVEALPQDESKASMTRRLSREDGWIDWNAPVENVARRWRALHPWPGVHTTASGRTLKILSCAVAGEPPGPPAAPGMPAVRGNRLFVAAHDGWLEITALQPEARPPLTTREFLAGYGALLESPWGA